MSQPPQQQASSEVQKGFHISLLQALAGQVVILAALLYSFGIVHQQMFWGSVGVDPKLVEDSSPYNAMIYGVPGLFVFAISAAVCVLTGLSVVFLSRKIIKRLPTNISNVYSERFTQFILSLLAVAALSALIDGLGPRTGAFAGIAAACVLGIYAAVFAANFYGLHRSPRTIDEDRGVARAPYLISASIALMSCLAAGLIATAASGWNLGVSGSSTQKLPSVTLYSEVDLQISYPGVARATIPGKGIKYKIKYSNLRLLGGGNGNLVLVGPQWERGQTYSLVDAKEVRLDLTVPRREFPESKSE